MHTRSLPAAMLIALAPFAPARAEEPLSDAQRIARVQAYSAALERHDYEAAQSYLSPDARAWYDKKEGEGEPEKAGAGTWTHWDTYFHGKTTRSDWRVEDGAVVASASETNDYYRLLDWKPWPMRFTWWLDGSGKITGFLVQSLPRKGSTGSRFKDAVAWAKGKHPEEIAYLMPKERIDPTADRAERWHKLLVEWRKEAGLPEVKIEPR